MLRLLVILIVVNTLLVSPHALAAVSTLTGSGGSTCPECTVTTNGQNCGFNGCGICDSGTATGTTCTSDSDCNINGTCGQSCKSGKCYAYACSTLAPGAACEQDSGCPDGEHCAAGTQKGQCSCQPNPTNSTSTPTSPVGY